MSGKSIVEAISERRSQSLTALVRDEIERQILGGEIAGGARLNEAALATRLGVSRGPIREAVRLLERDGLVTSIVNQGSFVRQVSIEEANELYELRAAIVGYACSTLAERITPEGLSELEGLVRLMDESAERGEAAAYYEVNLEFHDRIMEMAGRSRSAAIYQNLVKETHLFRRRSLMSAEAMAASNLEHREILDALARGDRDAAREAAERHHLNGKRRWLRTME